MTKKTKIIISSLCLIGVASVCAVIFFVSARPEAQFEFDVAPKKNLSPPENMSTSGAAVGSRNFYVTKTTPIYHAYRKRDGTIDGFHSSAERIATGQFIAVTDDFFVANQSSGKTDSVKWNQFQCGSIEGTECWVLDRDLMPAERVKRVAVVKKSLELRRDLKIEANETLPVEEGDIAFLYEQNGSDCLVYGRDRKRVSLNCSDVSNDPRKVDSALKIVKLNYLRAVWPHRLEPQVDVNNAEVSEGDVQTFFAEMEGDKTFAFPELLKSIRQEIDQEKKRIEEEVKRKEEIAERERLEWKKQREEEYKKMTPEERAEAEMMDEQECAGFAEPHVSFVDGEEDVRKVVGP